jgi:glycosyltransferase involved in cell wall biosynthesis
LHDVLRTHRPALFHATQPDLTPDPHQFPTVVTCYDLTPLHENIRNPLHRHAYATYLQRLVRAQLVMAISQATADDLTAQLGIPPTRIRVVRLGVPPPSAPAGPIPGGPYVLYANSIEPHKNPRVAIDAISRAPREIRLVMTGTWSDRRLRRLRHHARQVGADDRIDWLGYVSPGRLAALRRGAVAVLVPSRREGFGLPVLEALAAGTPVIAADIPALREVGGDAVTYLSTEDPGPWTDAIGDLAGNPGQRSAIGERGKAQAAKYTWQDTADRTVAAWKEVLAANG